MADLARIKNNVAKMVAQNAPEADIDGYIASEGVTIDAVRNFKMEAPKAKEEPKPAYSGSVLPLSRDSQGNVSFDSNAGILGALKRSFMLPGEVMAGKVDPTSQEGIGRAVEFASTFSPINPGIRAGEQLIPGVMSAATKTARVKTPTVEELKAAAGAGYQAVRNSGVDYSAKAVKGLAQSMEQTLVDDGILPELAPKTHAIIQKLQAAPDGSVAPIAGLDAARRAFRNAAKDFNNPTDQLAAQRAIDGLDKFVMDADPQSVVAGPAADIGRVLAEARGNYAAAKRGETLANLKEGADLSAAAANSGQNIGNSTRQRINSLVSKPKSAAAFNKSERDALKQVVKGNAATNATRFAGNLLGGGGGLGSMVTGAVGAAGAGASTGSPTMAALGAALPLAGYASKKASNALTEQALKKVSEMTLQRSPLYQQALKEAKKISDPAEKRAFLSRALIMISQQNSGQMVQPRLLAQNEL